MRGRGDGEAKARRRRDEGKAKARRRRGEGEAKARRSEARVLVQFGCDLSFLLDVLSCCAVAWLMLFVAFSMRLFAF